MAPDCPDRVVAADALEHPRSYRGTGIVPLDGDGGLPSGLGPGGDCLDAHRSTERGLADSSTDV